MINFFKHIHATPQKLKKMEKILIQAHSIGLHDALVQN